MGTGTDGIGYVEKRRRYFCSVRGSVVVKNGPVNVVGGSTKTTWVRLEEDSKRGVTIVSLLFHDIKFR